MTDRFFLPFDPPRVTGQMKGINFAERRVYTKPQVLEVAALFAWHLKKHIPPEPLKGAVSLSVTFYFAYSGKGHTDGEWKITKPDTDNLIHCILIFYFRRSIQMETNLTAVPVVPLRGPVLFPGMTLHFEVGRKKTERAVRKAAENGSDVLFVAQRDVSVENPSIDDLYPVGVLGKVCQVLRIPDSNGVVRVVAEGRKRAKIVEITGTSPYLSASVALVDDLLTVPEGVGDPVVFTDAALASLKKMFYRYCEEAQNIPPDVREKAFALEDPSALCDLIAANIMFPVSEKEEILAEPDVFLRAAHMCVLLMRATNVAAIENELEYKVQKQMDANQREY